MELHRRHFNALLLSAASLALPKGASAADDDPLPSWNDGPARQAILKFVHATTDPASPDFVPPADRIATFDQDGTLWAEQPIYTQIVFALSRVPEVVKERPELVNEPAFKAILSGDRAAIASLSTEQLLSVIGATLTGMDVDKYRDEVADWIQGRARSALEAAVHRARLPAADRAAQISARQRLPDLHRHRRRAGLRPHLRRADLRDSARAGGRNDVWAWL